MGILKLLIIIALLLPSLAWGAYTCTAEAPVTIATVQACIDAISSSDSGAATITIPECDVTFGAGAGGVTVNMSEADFANITSLTIQGSGTLGTILTDGTGTSWNESMFYFTMTNGKTLTIKNIYFKETNSAGALYLNGTLTDHTTNFRITANKFENTSGTPVKSIYINPSFQGLIDSNTFLRSGIDGSTNDTIATGNTLWQQAVSDVRGTARNVFVENNSFTHPTGVTSNCLDGRNGGSFVFRYNDVTNTRLEAHGTEQTDLRSSFSQEVYNNLFTFTANYSATALTAFTGGTAVIYNNRATTGAYTLSYGFLANNNRSCIYSGTATAGTSEAPFTVTVADAGWTVNEWAGDVVMNMSDLSGTARSYCTIASNTSDTITCSAQPSGGTTNYFQNGDAIKIEPSTHYSYYRYDMCDGDSVYDGNTSERSGFPCFDQPGYAGDVQDGGNSKGFISSGELTASTKYRIMNYSSNDDFSNCGFLNATGAEATIGESNCTPTHWAHGSILAYYVSGRQTSSPMYEWNNYKGADSAHWTTDLNFDNDIYSGVCTLANSHVAIGEALRENTELSYTPYQCPHDLATEYAGYTCDTAQYGKAGYLGSTSAASHSFSGGATHSFGSGSTITWQ